MSAEQYTTYTEFIEYMLEKYKQYGEEFVTYLNGECANLHSIADAKKISYLKIYIEMWILEKETDISY
jgi:hypothetical protein